MVCVCRESIYLARTLRLVAVVRVCAPRPTMPAYRRRPKVHATDIDALQPYQARVVETTTERQARYTREDREKEQHDADVCARGCVGWVPRSKVTRLFHEQMLLDLELERINRPSSGTEQKEMQGFSFEAEKYSFWTKVRGSAEHLASKETVAAIAALRANRDAAMARVEYTHCAGTVTQRYRALEKTHMTRVCELEVEKLLPMPMTTPHPYSWRALRYYGNVVRSADSATAFIDEQATRAECTLALQSGMHALLCKYPTLCFMSAALTTAWVEYLTHNQNLRSETKVERRARLQAKRLPADELLNHLTADKYTAASFPAEAVAVAIDTLAPTAHDDAVTHKKHSLYVLNLLAKLPGALLTPHSDAIDTLVATVSDAKLARLVETVVRHAYAPKEMNMAEECAKAMGVQ